MEHIDNRVTSKASVVGGGPTFPNLIEASLYDTNHIHNISMVTEELKWILKDEECLNFETDQV